MNTIYHLDPKGVELTDVLKSIAHGIHDHLFGFLRVDLYDYNKAHALLLDIDNAMLALSVLAHVAPLGFPDENDGNVHVDLTAYDRSCKFLHECGFSDEVIAKCGLSPDDPYGSL